MKKTILALTLSLLMTLSLLPTALAAPTGGASSFTDVTKSSPYYAGIDYACRTGLMNGVGSGKFDPDGLFSRAMFVTILGRMDGVDPADYPGASFSDVSVKSLRWAAPYIRWASENGIVNGYGSGKFGPNDPITREQYCAVVDRYCNTVHRGFTGPFRTPCLKDASSIADYAFVPVYNLTGYGLIDTENGFFFPGHKMSRGEIAVTFAEVHKMINKTSPGDMTTHYVMSHYLGWRYSEVTALFAGNPVLAEDWWEGDAKLFCDEYGYPPFVFAFNDPNFRGFALGKEPITLVSYVTGQGFPSVFAAPGINANATVAELQASGVPGILYLGEEADSGNGETAVFYIDVAPNCRIVFHWYSPGADPYTERADDVIVIAN